MPTFDARAAKQLKPGEHLTLEEAPGLRLEASESVRSWIYRYKSPLGNRGMKQIKIGPWPTIGYPQAIGLWSEFKSARDSGRCPAAERKAERGAQPAAIQRQTADVTVADVCDGYVDFVSERRKAKGAAEVKRMFKAMLTDKLRALPAAEVTRGVAFELINSYAEKPVMAKNLRSELGGAWDWAMDSGKLSQDVPNWWRQVLRGKLRSKGREIGGEKRGVVKVTLQPKEVGLVIRFLPNLSRLAADLMTMYLWTCCRGAEIVAMEGSEVAWESDGWWWTVPKHKTKLANHPGAPDHRVPLVGAALEVVRRRMEWCGGGYLFPVTNANAEAPHVQQKVFGRAIFHHRSDSKTHPNTVRPRWQVQHFAPHDLRRTGRTELAKLGCPDAIAEAILGHMPAGIAGVYNRHTYDKERRQWLTALSAHWEALAKR